jgi:hypothetical protein
MPNEPLYFIQWRGQESGPFSESEVLQKIETHEISPLHRIRCNEKITSVREWIDEAQSGSTPTYTPVANPPTPAAIPAPVQVPSVPAPTPPRPASKTLLVATNGKSSEYDENTVRSLLQQGIFSPDTLFWENGMSNWQPLSVLFPGVATAAPPPPPPPIPGQQYAPVEDSSKNEKKHSDSISLVLKRLIFLCVGLSGISAIGLAGQSYDLYIAFSYLAILCILATNIIFLIWVFRANKNCRKLGAAGMRFTPGWAVGDWFLPLFNFFRPYQIMSEIWRASHSPSDWKTQPGSLLVRVWWFLFLVTVYFARTADPGLLSLFSLPLAINGEAYYLPDPARFIVIANHLLLIPLSVITFLIVSKIDKMQRSLRDDTK